jgi:flagellar L-ring protein precursor FlgH
VNNVKKYLIVLVLISTVLGCQNVKNVVTTVDGIDKNRETPEYDTEKSRRMAEMPDISVFFTEEEMPEDKYSSSLWNVDGKSLYGDGRASRIGDIVFIIINEESNANLGYTHGKTGYTDYVPEENVLPEGVTEEDVAALEESTLTEEERRRRPDAAEALAARRPRPESQDYNATAASSRATSFSGKMAVRVEAVDKYGNLYLKGTKTTLLNNELVTLEVSGYARKEDISLENTIDSSSIENMEFTYNGAMYVGEPKVTNIGDNQRNLTDETGEVTEAILQPTEDSQPKKRKIWPFGSF